MYIKEGQEVHKDKRQSPEAQELKSYKIKNSN